MLIAYYPLDEDSGSTATDVAGSNDGTINGATVGQTGILGTTSYSFDGTDDDIQLPDPSTSLGSAFTVSFWFQLNSASGWTPYLTKTGSGDDANLEAPFDFRSSSDGASDVRFLFGESGVAGPGLASKIDSDNLTLDTWYHCVGTAVSGGRAELWINGVSQGSKSGQVIQDADQPIYAAWRSDDLGRADIYMDEIRIYDHALTATEVQHLYNVTQRNDYVGAVV